MANPALKPVWADQTFRLNPDDLDHQVTGHFSSATGDVAFTVDERGAVLKRVLRQSGLPLSIALPARAFNGVAARAIDHGNGEVTVTLELNHDDPDMTVPLLVAHDLDDIAADWRRWSEAYGIPMLMVEADGVARPLEEKLGQVKTNKVKPRRRHSFFADRRPRFLVRRTIGTLGVEMKIDGREIIARK